MATSHRWSAPPPEEREEFEAGLRFLNPRFAHDAIPWPQIAGYGLSLLLTAIATWLVVKHALTPSVLLAVILTLAGIQAFIQLGAFMHVRESRGSAWQLVPLGLVLGIAIGIVITAIWIMAFKWGVS